MFLSGGPSYPIGLDVSDLSLKVVQLKKIGKKVKIKALGRIDLPEGLIVDGEIVRSDEVAKELKRLLSNLKYGRVSSNRVIACLPETKTFVKLIELPNSPNELFNIIEPEIQKHVPLMIEDIYYDWQVIEKKTDSQLVLIGAAPKKIVNQYTNFFQKVRMSVEALEIEPVAICRALLKEESNTYKDSFENNYAIIDIGAVRTSMAIYSKQTILFTSSIPLSGQKITNDIADKLKIKKDEAEKAKLICGLDKNKCGGIVKDILSNTIDDLIEKIRDVLEFYENYHFERGPINKIFICGGGANIKKMRRIIEKSVNIEVARGSALVNIDCGKDKNESIFSRINNFETSAGSGKENSPILEKDTSLTFATAVGLALRGVFIDEL